MGDSLAIIAMRSASTDASATAWIVFNLVVVALLLLDLFGFNRKAHKIFLREAAWLSAFFVGCALVVNAWVWIEWGPDAGLTWFTGYVVEKSLSVDNLFVIAVLFGYFGVPAEYQHRVLFWGIFGAIVMRAIMILLGVALIERFDWVLYIFGAFLIFTGVKLMRSHESSEEPGNNPLLRALRRWIPVSRNYHGQKFFVRMRGRLVATPLFLVLVMIELTDVVFAVDSIPAILGITTDRFIAYTSNIMAVLGLRALYFLVAGVIERVRYLNIGLAVVLIFIGIKMMLEDVVHVPTFVSLSVIILTLAGAAIASWVVTRREKRAATFSPPPEETK